jgi:hypothetical protein
MQRSPVTTLYLILVTLVGGAQAAPTTAGGTAIAADAVETPAELAERMLEAIGGREAWARLRNTVNDSQQNRATEPTEVQAVITMDFERPRFRIETTGPGLHLIRVVDGERSWHLTRDGRIEPLPPDVLERELRWYSSHLYRTIHRIAARDPDVLLRIGSEGRLEALSRATGERLAWFQLDASGEPYAFGGADDGPGSLCGPWEFEETGIRHPLWVSSPDGTWRARILDLQLDVPLPPEVFEPVQAPPDTAVD